MKELKKINEQQFCKKSTKCTFKRVTSILIIWEASFLRVEVTQVFDPWKVCIGQNWVADRGGGVFRESPDHWPDPTDLGQTFGQTIGKLLTRPNTLFQTTEFCLKNSWNRVAICLLILYQSLTTQANFGKHSSHKELFNGLHKMGFYG